MAKEVELLLQIDQKRLTSWRESARRCNMTVNDWLVMCITLADRLRLVEGSSKLPSKGKAIDPVLAEAIRRAAAGKPWEHKALLLIGASALAPNAHNEDDPSQRIKLTPANADNANDLMVEHGLPRTARRGQKMHASIGGNSYTWYETAILLYLHDRTREGWATIHTTDLCDLCSLNAMSIAECLRRLKLLGRIEEMPTGEVPNQGKRRNKKRMVRLQPVLHAAIDAGDIQLLNSMERQLALPERKEEEAVVAEAKRHDPRYVAMMARIAAEHQKMVEAELIHE